MKKPEKNSFRTDRRKFISTITALAATGLVGSAAVSEDFIPGSTAGEQAPVMPTINLGPHRISRLICGSNPFLGYSYMGPHVDRHMKEYFTAQRAADLLTNCEKAGITAHQCSSRLDYFPVLRERGSKLKFIALMSGGDKVNETIEAARPIALVHHGGDTDRAFAAGKAQTVRDFVKMTKDKGMLAGVSSHNPDVVKQIADEGWENDFFMTCFYFLTRKPDKDKPDPILAVGNYNFYRDDPKRMTDVVKQVSKPCLGFKILGAGRMTTSQEKVRAAFKFAFENIKPIDGVIVGMFPWYFDEVGANTQYARELGG